MTLVCWDALRPEHGNRAPWLALALPALGRWVKRRGGSVLADEVWLR